MSFWAFLLEATLISLSGVLAPGPITAVVVGKGGKSPHAGALVAIGHGIVEVPLMVAVFYGVGRLMELSYVQAGIALLGGLLLLVMGVGMLRSIRQAEVGSGQDTRSPIVAGILLSIGNPYFLVWWATVGAALIMRSFRFGVLGFVAFGALH
jgi:threonine/homoserine/homoserine lactone efflux protein